MSLTWVIAGSIAQGCLAMFLFMLGAFAGGGLANGGNLSRGQIAILDSALYLLPASCIVSAAVVIYLYHKGATANAYWWYVLPILCTVIYFTYTNRLSGR